MGICVIGSVATRTLKVAERRAAPRVEQGLYGGIGVLGSVVDLRHVGHGRNAVVELAQRTE